MMEPEILDVFNGFCQITGKSRSSIINEMLRPSLPTLQKLIELNLRMKLRSLSNGEADQLEILEGLNDIEEKLLTPLEQLPNVIDKLQSKIKD